MTWATAGWVAGAALAAGAEEATEAGSAAIAPLGVAVRLAAVGGCCEVSSQAQRQRSAESGWNETARRQATRPFTMDLSNGQRLQVEPGDETQLLDSLHPPVGVSHPFWVSATSGEAMVATVVAKRTAVVKRDEQRDLHTDVVTFRVEGTGQRFNDWVAPAWGLETGARVPVFLSPSWLAYAHAGKAQRVDIKEAQPSATLAVFGAFSVIALSVVFGLGRYIRTRPWWERARLDETVADELFPEPE